MPVEFDISGAVGGIGDVAAVGRHVERDGPVGDTSALGGDCRGPAIDRDGGDLPVVVRDAADKSLDSGVLDAGDQRRRGKSSTGASNSGNGMPLISVARASGPVQPSMLR